MAETQLMQPKIVKTRQRNQTAKNESNLGLKRGRQGNLFKERTIKTGTGKKQIQQKKKTRMFSQNGLTKKKQKAKTES